MSFALSLHNHIGLRSSTPSERCHTQVPDDHGFGLVCTPKENIYCLSGSQLHYRELIAITSSYCSSRERKLAWRRCFTSSFGSLFGLIIWALHVISSSELHFALCHRFNTVLWTKLVIYAALHHQLSADHIFFSNIAVKTY